MTVKKYVKRYLEEIFALMMKTLDDVTDAQWSNNETRLYARGHDEYDEVIEESGAILDKIIYDVEQYQGEIQDMLDDL